VTVAATIAETVVATVAAMVATEAVCRQLKTYLFVKD